MGAILTYEEAKIIYQAMEEHLDRQDEDIMDIYSRMMDKAVRYANVRAGWQKLTREEKLEQDESRTALHDSFISNLNVIARTEGEAGKEWREQLTEDRKRIGDFACYIALFLAIGSR